MDSWYYIWEAIMTLVELEPLSNRITVATLIAYIEKPDRTVTIVYI